MQYGIVSRKRPTSHRKTSPLIALPRRNHRIPQGTLVSHGKSPGALHSKPAAKHSWVFSCPNPLTGLAVDGRDLRILGLLERQYLSFIALAVDGHCGQLDGSFG